MTHRAAHLGYGYGVWPMARRWSEGSDGSEAKPGARLNTISTSLLRD